MPEDLGATLFIHLENASQVFKIWPCCFRSQANIYGPGRTLGLLFHVADLKNQLENKIQLPNI